MEPFIYEKLEKDTYEVLSINPIKLLTWNRLDLAFKLFYLDNYQINHYFRCGDLISLLYEELN